MTWYKVSLTPNQIQALELGKLIDKFVQLFIAAGKPKEMALFGEKELSNNDQVLYFSPACSDKAASLISAYSGIPCEKPEKESLNRLQGGTVDFDSL